MKMEKASKIKIILGILATPFGTRFDYELENGENACVSKLEFVIIIIKNLGKQGIYWEEIR